MATGDAVPTQPQSPIPLRALIVLLKYELFRTNNMLNRYLLLNTSIANPAIAKEFLKITAKQHPTLPKSIRYGRAHVFSSNVPIGFSLPTDTLYVHPDAPQSVKDLSPAQKEQIYNETRAQDTCAKAIILYDFFLKYCPADQKISIQLKNEAPVVVDASSAQLLEVTIRDPKSLIMFQRDDIDQCFVGLRQDEYHIVLAFPHPDTQKPYYIVDMSRIQYGEVAGRGQFGEGYFLGDVETFKATMHVICDANALNPRPRLFSEFLRNQLDKKGDMQGGESRLKFCASTMWKRWLNRDIVGWCNFCGKGDGFLMKCSSCKKVSYCSKAHQKTDWKLHKLLCGRA